MEESYVKEPTITPSAYAKTIVKTNKAFKLAWCLALSPAAEYNIIGRTMTGPELEQLLADKFMEKELFQYNNERIEGWASRLQKACEEHPNSIMLQLIQGRFPDWWAWSLSRGFLGAPFVNGQVGSVCREFRKFERWPQIFQKLGPQKRRPTFWRPSQTYAFSILIALWRRTGKGTTQELTPLASTGESGKIPG
jgi:hypothetical protein